MTFHMDMTSQGFRAKLAQVASSRVRKRIMKNVQKAYDEGFTREQAEMIGFARRSVSPKVRRELRAKASEVRKMMKGAKLTREEAIEAVRWLAEERRAAWIERETARGRKVKTWDVNPEDNPWERMGYVET